MEREKRRTPRYIFFAAAELLEEKSDWLRATLLHVRPYWCEECGQKFYKNPAEDEVQEV
jgi:hypothetical protein